MNENARRFEFGILGESATVDVLPFLYAHAVEVGGVEMDQMNEAHHDFSGGVGMR
jgi:hypothetical protein